MRSWSFSIGKFMSTKLPFIAPIFLSYHLNYCAAKRKKDIVTALVLTYLLLCNPMETLSSPSAPMDTDNSVPTQPENPKFFRVFEVFSWENTQSNLTHSRPNSTRIPPAADLMSAFLDVQKIPNDLDGRDIAQALPVEAISSKFWADTNFIQLFFN